MLGVSMIKHTKVWELLSTIDHKHNTYVRSLSVSKARSMKDYVKACVRDEQPDHIIVHVETNNLNSENNPGRAPESIVDFVKVWFLIKGRFQFLESYPKMTNVRKDKRSKTLFERQVA